MLNKFILSSLALAMMVGCQNNPVSEPPFPAEFIGADYILSDENAQKWVIASRQAEQCIYPHLTRIQQQHFSPADAYIHAQYVLFYPLEKIIGENYVKLIQYDEKSMGYAQLLFKKYKDIDVKSLAKSECKTLQMNAKDDLAVLKGEYKSGMATDAPKSEKNPDGVATNENKFFFDIIKWGAALLL